MAIKLNMDRFSIGALLEGTAVNLAPFGVFFYFGFREPEALLHFDRTPRADIARRLEVGLRIPVVVTEVSVEKELVRVALLPEEPYELILEAAAWANAATAEADKMTAWGPPIYDRDALAHSADRCRAFERRHRGGKDKRS